MPCARNLMFWSEGRLLMLASAANGEETEGEIAMGVDADIRRTGDGYKIPAGQVSSLPLVFEL